MGPRVGMDMLVKKKEKIFLEELMEDGVVEACRTHGGGYKKCIKNFGRKT
jgi:hypothetical protein